MSKVITFSRVFPSYHPRKGEPTHFVEAMMNSLYPLLPAPKAAVKLYDNPNFKLIGDKHHTIRAGHRWKVGDKFSPRVWSGIPYKSKQITFAPDIEIKKVWDFSFLSTGLYRIGTRQYDGEVESHHELLEEIAKNDGLSKQELLQWFIYPRFFDGQIICWNENINY